jgi:GAF domain-containing protein
MATAIDGMGERLRHAEALLAISTTVTATRDVPEALRRICRELAHLLGADTAAAYRCDPLTEHIVPVAGYHVPQELIPTLLGSPLALSEQGFYSPIWQERRPVMSNDVAADPRFGHELFRRFRHQSGLVIPLVLDEQVAGAFYLVWWTARRQLTEREEQLLGTVTAQVAVLLGNAGRFERAERERHRLGVMYELGRRMAAVQDSNELLALIVDEAARVLGVEAAGLRLLEGDDLVMAARTSAAAGFMKRERIKIGESLTGHVVSTGAPLAVEDVADDPRFDPGHRHAAVELGFHAFLGVPLKLHQRSSAP